MWFAPACSSPPCLKVASASSFQATALLSAVAAKAQHLATEVRPPDFRHSWECGRPIPPVELTPAAGGNGWVAWRIRTALLA